MREVYVADSDADAHALAYPYLLQYWELSERYAQFTRTGKLLDSYDFWRRQAPVLHRMSFDEIVETDMVLLGSPQTVADAILRLAGQLELMGLAMIFKLGALGAMPYDKVVRSMTLFGEKVMPRISHPLERAKPKSRDGSMRASSRGNPIMPCKPEVSGLRLGKDRKGRASIQPG
jgi:alkanesulfonate monooxygenase SsuD/methylene tetrahydromethanopterin reductase-like flavin-dependent oxidoreductase (luciferase family)